MFKVAHELPGEFRLDYILMPYGEFYQKTKVLLNAKKGDTLRFFNGPDVSIEFVSKLRCGRMCDFLCMMRYGITWDKAYDVWLSYARMEGHGKDILSKDYCLLITYKNEN